MLNPIPPLQAVIFDLDDTLYACSTAIHTAQYQQSILASSMGLDQTAFLKAARTLHADSAQDILDYLGSDLPSSPLDQIFYHYTTTSLQIHPGVQSLLRDLKAHQIKIGIVTNGDPDKQRLKINNLNLTDLIDAVVVANEHDLAKPEPAAFHRILSSLQVEPSHTLMVGDRPDIDILGAYNASIPSIRLIAGNSADILPSPHSLAEFENLDEAWEFIRSLL